MEGEEDAGCGRTQVEGLKDSRYQGRQKARKPDDV